MCSPLNPGNEEFAKSLEKHGDGVKDVAFTCEDARGVYEKAVSRGAKGIKAPEELSDENGTVIVATIQTYGDTYHSFVQRNDYKGPFLPGFRTHHFTEPFNAVMEAPEFLHIDHVVGNQPDLEMEPTA